MCFLSFIVIPSRCASLALTESVSVCVFLQQRNLEGYVGFANLPNQVYRKSVKRGFEFTLMVVGKLETSTSDLWLRMWMCLLASADVIMWLCVCVSPSQTYECTPGHLSVSTRPSVFSFLCECGSSAQVERRWGMCGIQSTQLLRMTSWQFKNQCL